LLFLNNDGYLFYLFTFFPICGQCRRHKTSFIGTRSGIDMTVACQGTVIHRFDIDRRTDTTRDLLYTVIFFADEPRLFSKRASTVFSAYRKPVIIFWAFKIFYLRLAFGVLIHLL